MKYSFALSEKPQLNPHTQLKTCLEIGKASGLHTIEECRRCCKRTVITAKRYFLSFSRRISQNICEFKRKFTCQRLENKGNRKVINKARSQYYYDGAVKLFEYLKTCTEPVTEQKLTRIFA